MKLVRGAFAAFGRGDISQVIDLMADDLVTHRVEPDDAVYHGKDGFFQATAESMRTLRIGPQRQRSS